MGVNTQLRYKHRIDFFPDFLSISQEAQSAGINYVLEGKLAGASNQETAGELEGILNNLAMFRKDKYLWGNIFYKEKGVYVSWNT